MPNFGCLWNRLQRSIRNNDVRPHFCWNTGRRKKEDNSVAELFFSFFFSWFTLLLILLMTQKQRLFDVALMWDVRNVGVFEKKSSCFFSFKRMVVAGRARTGSSIWIHLLTWSRSGRPDPLSLEPFQAVVRTSACQCCLFAPQCTYYMLFVRACLT